MSSLRSEFAGGWRNLVAATIGMALGVPSYVPVSSLFFRALETEYGWTRSIAVGAVIAMPLAALVFPAAGYLIDRFGVRLCTGFSIVSSAISYYWLAHLGGSVTGYYIAIILLNVLGCATGPIAYTRLVAAQFRANRGLALGISQFGIALFAVVLPPILSAILASSGVAGGYLFMMTWGLVGGLIAQVAMQPAIVELAEKVDQGSGAAGAARTGAFWLLGTAILLISSATLGFVSQAQSLLIERGVEVPSTTRYLSLLAVAVLLSRLVVGRFLDQRNPGTWAALVCLVSASGALVLYSCGGHLVLVALGIVLLGCSVGAELDLMSFFCARIFGVRHYAAIYGMLSIFFYSGIAIGGFGYSAARDVMGSYDHPLAGTAFLLCLAAWMFKRLDNIAKAHDADRANIYAPHTPSPLRTQDGH